MSFNLSDNGQSYKSEEKRIKALKAYHILDSDAEKEFDDLARLASYICNTPVALISFIDDKRQWFKSKIGWTQEETEKEIAFCLQTINQNDIYEISDATKNEIFCNNPLVNNENGIVFYAGMPLITHEGYELGTLCVIDYIPKHLDEKQKDALRTLASEVILRLENRKEKINLEKDYVEKNDHLEKANQHLHEIIEKNKKVEAQLRQNEYYYKKLLKNSSEIITILDDKGNAVFQSPSIEYILGYKPEELIGRNMFDYIHPEDKEYLEKEFNQLLANPDDVIKAEYRFLHKKRYWHYLYKTSMNLLHDENIQGIVINSKDIHQKKINDSALEFSEYRYKELVDFLPALIFKCDINGDCIYVNDKWYELTGLSKKEAMGKGWLNAIHPDDVDNVKKEWYEKTIYDGKFDLEFRFKSIDGKISWLMVKATSEKDLQGNILNFMGVASDVTQIKNVKKELDQKENFLNRLIHSSQQLIFVKDRQGYFRFCNQQFAKIFNSTPEEMIGKKMKDFASLNYNEVRYFDAKNKEVILNNYASLTVEGAITDQSKGKKIHLQMIKVPIEINNEKHVLSISSDITERKNLENDLLRKNNELETFLYKTSHDLRGPISTILGLINVGKLDFQEPKAHHYLKNIEDQIHELDQILVILNYVTQLMQNNYPLYFLNVSNILEKNLDENFADRNVFIKKEFSRNKNYHALGNVELLNIVFKHLMENCIKFRKYKDNRDWVNFVSF